jgi:hypothetical protein
MACPYLGSRVRLWHLADFDADAQYVRFLAQSGHQSSAIEGLLMTLSRHFRRPDVYLVREPWQT